MNLASAYSLAFSPLIGMLLHLSLLFLLPLDFYTLAGLFFAPIFLFAIIDKKQLDMAGVGERVTTSPFLVPLYLFERSKVFDDLPIYPMLFLINMFIIYNIYRYFITI